MSSNDYLTPSKPKLKKYTQEEIYIITELWPRHTRKELEELIHIFGGIDIIQLDRKAGSLNLKKTDVVKEKLLAAKRELCVNRNKFETGRNLTEEFIREIALQYKSKQEFRKFDVSAYTQANKFGIIDDVCSHMIIGDTYNLPQTFLFCCIKELFPGKTIRYNDRTAIKPKEIDVYVVEDKIGFEYDGVNFHQNDDNTKDELCKGKGIKLYRIKEVNKYKPEPHIISALFECGFDISHLDEKKLQRLAIDKKISREYIFETVSKYTKFKDFKANENSLYTFLSRKGILLEYTSHLLRDTVTHTKEGILEKIKECKTKLDFCTLPEYKNYYASMMRQHRELIPEYKKLK